MLLQKQENLVSQIQEFSSHISNNFQHQHRDIIKIIMVNSLADLTLTEDVPTLPDFKNLDPIVICCRYIKSSQRAVGVVDDA